MMNIKSLAIGMLVSLAVGCSTKKSDSTSLSLPFEKYTLDNGLEVVLHEDKSDPIVAVAIVVHVGSNREKPGRTGFAHFFEHMLFQKSENVPQGGFFKNIDEWGGTFNGGTSNDFTIYFETIPKDALEKVLWMESDRMGFFINAIGIAELEGEKPVVQNEKRQRVDSQPYGHTDMVIRKALYPEGHPYNWTVIGELEDLQNATLEDVKEFYEQWYGPNNATLVVAGDFSKDNVKGLIEKYFGEIPRRGNDVPMEPMPVTLSETKVLVHEDNFARLPEIRLTFPTVEQYHPDQWALDVLSEILSDGKRAPLYKVLVEKAQIAPENNVNAFHSANELAGTFTIRVRSNAGVDLDSVRALVNEAMLSFETNGVDPADLSRIKARLETDFYNQISSIFFKSLQLALYNEYKGDPGFITQDLDNIRKVSESDILRVYNTYIKGKNHIVTNFVPKGMSNLALEGAKDAGVKEEVITAYQPKEILENENDIAIVKTSSSFDRSTEPDFGEKPLVTPPVIWTQALSNGLLVTGTSSNELPLVNFSLRIMGGHYLDDPAKVGVANMIADMMMEGTAKKTAEELEDAIGQLGSSITMTTSDEFITIRGNCLARNYQATVALLSEILLEPRWDEAAFDRVKKSTLTSIIQRESNPNAVATVVFNKLIFGEGHILSHPVAGYTESVESISLDDIKEFYRQYFAPGISKFNVAGAVSQEDVIKSLDRIRKDWSSREVNFPKYEIPSLPDEPKVYFVDVPQSKQSFIRIGRMAMKGNDDRFNDLMIANDRLGASSSGRLFQVLREERQYTYGAYSGLNRAALAPGRFVAQSSVQTNVTKEAIEAFNEVIGGFGDTFTEEDLSKSKSSMLKQNALRFETLGDLLGIIESITTYDLPMDYIAKEQEDVTGMTVDKVKAIAEEYMNMNTMLYVIVGDKATQYDRLRVEGMGDPILVDKDGKQVLLP